jgi:hypothetical protein
MKIKSFFHTFLKDYENNYRYSPLGSIPKEKVTIPSDLSSSDKRIFRNYLFQFDEEERQKFFANTLLKTFSFNGNKVSLPPLLWDFHGSHFKSALKKFETCDDNFEYQDNVSQESVQIFTQALKVRNPCEILTLETLKDDKIFGDLRLLAEKYQVQKLINDCNDYSELFNIYVYLIKEAGFRNSRGVFSAIKWLREQNIQEGDSNTLAQVAKKYQLADLYLFSLCDKFPFDKESVKYLIKALEMKNSWHFPTPVLNFWKCLENIDLVKDALNKTSLSPIFIISNRNITLPPGLNDKLMANPEIKHLIIEIKNNRQDDLYAISEFIQGNTTLKSLHIKFHYDPQIPYAHNHKDLISKAFNLNNKNLKLEEIS